MTIETDRENIAADGSDFSRVIVTAVDANGTVVPDFDGVVSLELKGPGRLIGDNPFKLRSGKFAVLASSFYETGIIDVEATAAGVKPATTRLMVCAVAGDVYFPETLPNSEDIVNKVVYR